MRNKKNDAFANNDFVSVFRRYSVERKEHRDSHPDATAFSSFPPDFPYAGSQVKCGLSSASSWHQAFVSKKVPSQLVHDKNQCLLSRLNFVSVLWRPQTLVMVLWYVCV